MSNRTDEEMAVLQGIVERISSYQEAAPEGMVEGEIRKALAETDLELAEPEILTLAEAIEARDKSTDTVEVREVLG